MADKLSKDVITATNEFLEHIEINKKELLDDKYLYSSFIEICKVLDSTIKVIEMKIERRKKHRSR